MSANQLLIFDGKHPDDVAAKVNKALQGRLLVQPPSIGEFQGHFVVAVVVMTAPTEADLAAELPKF